MLTEIKMETINQKRSDMNYDPVNNGTDWPATIDNIYTPDAAIFAAASAIALDAHFLPSGLKLDTEIFLKGNIKNMADKDTINTTPSPHVPDADITDAAAQDDGCTGSNSPYSLRNYKFPPYSTNTTKNQKKR